MSTPQSYNKVDSASPLNAKDSAVKSNIQALADLFPAAVQEGVVDFDALTRILGGKTEPQPERFGLNWCGKAAAHAGALVDSAGTLRPCREESKDWDTTKNLYIEGDNLEVLKLLRNSYRGKVKMIYIDPPYNTGKDFVYKDNFHDSIKNYQQITDQQNELKENRETSGRYHTDWLNMMYPRLMLARELLCDDGVIFISIDDHEAGNLGKICDEIFGESNFLAQVVWERAFAPINLKKHFSASHDYIVCYAKNIELAFCHGIPRSTESNSRYDNPDNDIRGAWSASDISVGPAIEENIYEITTPSGRVVLPAAGRCWSFSEEVYHEKLADNRIWFGRDGNGVPRLKRFLSELQKDGITPMTIWKHTEVGHSQEATQVLIKLFNGEKIFDYPKSVELIKRCISLYSEKDSLVLDFFSGSATTAHAVIKLNEEDGGSRRFIMVQLPEHCKEESEAYKSGYKNICEIGKERIRRAGEKVKAEAGDKINNLDIGFRVYKLDSSNVYAWDPDTKDIEKSLEQAANHLKEERNAEDIMTELMLRFGIMLTNNIEKEECGDTGLEVYNIGCGRHFACLDERLAAHAEEVAHFILEWHKEENPGTHEEEAKDCQVFVVDKAFVGNDAAKKNFCAILSDYGIKQVNAF